MAKKGITRYRCAECGALSLTYVGKCPDCGAWGTLAEEEPLRETKQGFAASVRAEPVSGISVKEQGRVSSGIGELDRVLGGGWVAGGVTLLGGEPGVGKSTLLLQVCAQMAKAGYKTLYLSGEESGGQLALRARRLGIHEEKLDLLCEGGIIAMLEAAKGYGFLVVDSVQAFRVEDESGWAGSLSQVRGVASRCAETAKTLGIPTVVVGHITKQGQIAGPKTLEHMVDVVLLFSGEKTSSHRLLRAEKNRFGSTEELGIFEMTERGLEPVLDPSRLYWSAQEQGVPGVAMCVSLEGSRPLVAEIQALSCNTPFQYPKRTSRGIELNRLQLLLAVLERRCGIFSRSCDVYANVAGGLWLDDPAADLAICAALASSLKDTPIPGGVCFVGETGLAGEVRPAAKTASRLREAARLGFKRAFISGREAGDLRRLREAESIEITRVNTISQMLERLII